MKVYNLWTKLTNNVDNPVNNSALIHTKCNKKTLPYPLYTFIRSYKTCFNTKKESYQGSMSRKIINFACCKQMLKTLHHNTRQKDILQGDKYN